MQFNLTDDQREIQEVARRFMDLYSPQECANYFAAARHDAT